MYSIKDSNPTKLYFTAVNDLIGKGEVCKPRGKLIKELRPASVEFTNPHNRITFLGGRRVNPFFMIAESLWIISGRADVEWLTQFNANMASFSDDGTWFNAPYGERIRAWGKNAAHNIVINPVDQLMDVYTKFLADKDTRQAVIVISNPSFDNSKYTIGEQGKDIACNLVITFKIRDNKLNMTVFNRSNDVHWGLFGANLCQFTTIQEVLVNWLKGSGVEGLADLEMGEYCQVTDSLHTYLDDYGSKCTIDVLDYYKEHPEDNAEVDFICVNEPRMSLNEAQFEYFLQTYWNMIDPCVTHDGFLTENSQLSNLLNLIDEASANGTLDDYWFFGIKSMIAYRLVKLDKLDVAMNIMETLTPCQWKISMMYFLKTFIYKVGKDESRMDEFNDIVDTYRRIVSDIKAHLVNPENGDKLDEYLKLF